MGRFGKGGLFLDLFLDPGATVGEGGGWGFRDETWRRGLGLGLFRVSRLLMVKVKVCVDHLEIE